MESENTADQTNSQNDESFPLGSSQSSEIILPPIPPTDHKPAENDDDETGEIETVGKMKNPDLAVIPNELEIKETTPVKEMPQKVDLPTPPRQPNRPAQKMNLKGVKSVYASYNKPAPKTSKQNSSAKSSPISKKVMKPEWNSSSSKCEKKDAPSPLPIRPRAPQTNHKFVSSANVDTSDKRNMHVRRASASKLPSSTTLAGKQSEIENMINEKMEAANKNVRRNFEKFAELQAKKILDLEKGFSEFKVKYDELEEKCDHINSEFTQFQCISSEMEKENIELVKLVESLSVRIEYLENNLKKNEEDQMLEKEKNDKRNAMLEEKIKSMEREFKESIKSHRMNGSVNGEAAANENLAESKEYKDYVNNLKIEVEKAQKERDDAMKQSALLEKERNEKMENEIILKQESEVIKAMSDEIISAVDHQQE